MGTTRGDQAVELMRAALAEMVPGFNPTTVQRMTYAGFSSVSCPKGVDPAILMRARYLSILGVYGADYPVICPDHGLINDPATWHRCLKIPVRDALIGRTCGEP